MYNRTIAGKKLTFGISGLLYKSNVLMYDHQTESLWSQIKGEAVTGPLTGTPLEILPSTLTTWKKWEQRFPDTEVLSTETGHQRDYSRDPYESYYEREKGLFSFFKAGPNEEEKQLVAGIAIDGKTKAYPLSILRKRETIQDTLGEKHISLIFHQQTDVLKVLDSKGQEIPHVIVYWFVWKAIHTESGLYH